MNEVAMCRHCGVEIGFVGRSYHQHDCPTLGRRRCHVVAVSPTKMTTNRAAEVLNARRHDDCTNWYTKADFVLSDSPGLQVFTSFEAIAIAEKYEREGR